MHVSRWYTVTKRGRVWRPITCQHCGLQWAYLLMRKADGTGESEWLADDEGAQARAQEEASRLLEQQLESDIEPIGCPQCHKLQADMFHEAALREHARWYLFAGVAALGAVLSFWGWGLASPGFPLLAAAVALAVTGARLISRYDGNRDDRVRARAEANDDPRFPIIRRNEYEELTRKGPSRFFGNIRWAP